jgi:hypothetical protein
MAVVKCGRGHFYDDAKYDKCPMCNKSEQSRDDDIKTMSFFSAPQSNTDDEKTIGINFKKNKCDPVVGWLVCTDGPEKGRDYRIRSGRNFIGRDYSNDISLPDDPAINRKDAGYIIYEPHKNMFLAVNGESAVITVNGDLANTPMVITEDDDISIGAYRFALVAYCKGDKRW